MKTRILLLCALWAALAVPVSAQSTPNPTTFTYQGRLTAGDQPASGTYDLVFALYDQGSGGSALVTATVNQVPVSNGLFTVQLDFDAGGTSGSFNGNPRWLEIRTRPTTPNGGPFQILQPRQPFTSAPYAIFAYNAATATTANTATSFTGPVTDTQLPASVARLGAAQTFTANNRFTAILTASNPANSFAGTFTGSFFGDGLGLTQLHAASVTAGTLDDARLSGNVARLTGNQQYSGIKVFQGAVGIGGMPVDSLLDVEGNSHFNDFSLFLRGASLRNDGLGWFGPNRLFASSDTAGPVLFGERGGSLGTRGQVEQRVLNWNADGRVGINTTAPDTALHVEDFDATLRLKNRNDQVGGFVGNTFSSLQLGLYNPAALGFDQIPASTARSFFAFSSNGRVGSVVNNFVGEPVYRNLLDDGSGTLGVSGHIRTMAANQPLDLRVSSNGDSFVSGLRILPGNLANIGQVPHLAAGSSANTIAASLAGSSILGGGANGSPNVINASFSVIGGGFGQRIEQGASLAGIFAGSVNQVQGLGGFIGGGISNVVQTAGQYAMIPGGVANIAGGFASFAAGHAARANQDGTFVWADNYTDNNKAHPPFASARANEFAVRATGGARFVSGFTAGTIPPLPVGVVLNSGSGSWSTLSDRRAKTSFAPVQPKEVLAKVAALPVQSWRYRSEPESTRHVGPVAQDFHAAFGLGPGETTIDTVDADGVALAAIQGLNQKVEEQAAEIRELRELVRKLARQLDAQP
jgi:hypothetical protein